MKHAYWKPLTLTLLTALPLAAHAQATYEPGYVVPLTGDTVRGRVDQRAARLNALACHFERADGQVITYRPAELRGYGVDRQAYCALTLPAAVGPARQQFVEVLRDGPAQLYFGRDDAGDHYYLRTPSLPLAELRHEYKHIHTEEHEYEEEQNGFRQLLAQGLAGCSAAQVLLPRLPFTEPALARAVDAYNHCVQPQASARAGASPSRPRIGLELIGGVQQGQLVFNDPQSDTERHTATVAGPVYGLGMWLQPARLAGRFSAHLQVLYQPQQYSYAYTPSYHGGLSGQPVSASGHVDYLRGALLGRYKVPLGALRVVFDGGLSVAPVVNGAGTYHYVSASGRPSDDPLAGSQARPLAKTDVAVLAGTGLSAPVLGGRVLSLLARLEYSVAGSTSATLVGTGLRAYGLLSFDLLR